MINLSSNQWEGQNTRAKVLLYSSHHYSIILALWYGALSWCLILFHLRKVDTVNEGFLDVMWTNHQIFQCSPNYAVSWKLPIESAKEILESKLACVCVSIYAYEMPLFFWVYLLARRWKETGIVIHPSKWTIFLVPWNNYHSGRKIQWRWLTVYCRISCQR